MNTTGSPPPSRARAASSSRLGSAVQSTASGEGSGGAIGPPFQTNGVVAGSAPGVSLEKVAEQGGIPAQHDAVSVAGFAEDGVERGGAVTLHQGFGPRND